MLVDLWYPGEIRPEPAEPGVPASDGLLYMFLHRDAAGDRTHQMISERSIHHNHSVDSAMKSSESKMHLQDVLNPGMLFTLGHAHLPSEATSTQMPLLSEVAKQ